MSRRAEFRARHRARFGHVPRAVWDRKAASAMINAVLAAVKERVFGRRLDGEGKPFPSGITLVDTGALKRATKVLTRGRMRLRLGVRGSGREGKYGSILDHRFHWLALAPEDLAVMRRFVRQGVIDAMARSRAARI